MVNTGKTINMSLTQSHYISITIILIYVIILNDGFTIVLLDYDYLLKYVIKSGCSIFANALLKRVCRFKRSSKAFLRRVLCNHDSRWR